MPSKTALVAILFLCLPGCVARTNPSGEALRQYLAKEGNPTSWTFHAPPEKVIAALRNTTGSSQTYWELSGSGTESLPKEVLELHRAWQCDSPKFFVDRRPRNTAGQYIAHLKLHLTEIDNGTRVDVEAIASLVTIFTYGEYWMHPSHWCCCICDPLGGLNGPGHTWFQITGPDVLFSTMPVPSVTVAEYDLLRQLGVYLGESRMPEIRYPTVEILP